MNAYCTLDASTVAAASVPQPWTYAGAAPYLPDREYPELRGKVATGTERNVAYELVREAARQLGLDAARYGSPDWNPLGDIVRPGDNVVVKPNLVRHFHLGSGDYQAVVTHGSIIRAVLDYVALALSRDEPATQEDVKGRSHGERESGRRPLKGRGRITVGDAPIQSADFETLLRRTGLKEVCRDVSDTWQIAVGLEDFRLLRVTLDEHHRVIDLGVPEGNPAGAAAVDLGHRSLLVGIGGDSERFRVTNYDAAAMGRCHNEQTHRYFVSRRVLEADVVISLPKLKTHRKAGMTAALKNLVGICGHKDCLPHHRRGSAAEGGDEYRGRSTLKRFQTRLHEAIDCVPRSRLNPLRRLAVRIAGRLGRRTWPDPFVEGSWYGNDTLWRTVLDLNRILLYADRNGRITDVPQRRGLSLVDALIAGEGEGPMLPDARPCGLLVAGQNPVAVDAALATMIGFDYTRIPLIARALELTDLPLADFSAEQVEIISDDARLAGLAVGDYCDALRFRPSSGWVGQVESTRHDSPTQVVQHVQTSPG